MLREFQDEIARLRAELAAAEDGAEPPPESGHVQPGLGADAGTAAGPAELAEGGDAGGEELGPGEVARLRRQLEAELRAEYSRSSGLEVDAAALAQVKGGRGLPAYKCA